MLIKTLPVGQLETNCYIVINEKTLECAVIDPGDESNSIMDYLEDNNLKCKAIMLTHGHFDHVGAADALQDETGAVVYMNERDSGGVDPMRLPYVIPENGKSYDDGDVITVAGLDFHVIATPGHTPGGVTLMVEDVLFTGDTLFRGSCGRTDFPGCSTDDLMRSLKKLCAIKGDYEVYPGHMDCTSLERERALNYYCRRAMSDY